MFKLSAMSALVAAATIAGPAVTSAQEKISGDVVKIGVLTDMSGAYSGNVGPGSVLATKLAIEDFGGKVAGKPIEMVFADHLNKADVGASRAREWMDRDGVDVVTELGNSAVALAVMNIAAEKIASQWSQVQVRVESQARIASPIT